MGSTPEIVEVGDARYAKHGEALLALLADGTPGPVVGRVDADGGTTIDEEACAGEWVGELLTATLPRRDSGVPLPTLPASVRESVLGGRAAVLPGALTASAVARCREELSQLEADGALRRGNHGQAASTRGDRIAFVALGGEDDDEHEPCPPHLRRAFAMLENAGAQLEDALGCGTLLVPRVGMVAVYDGRYGYVRHLDNERVPPEGDSGGSPHYGDDTLAPTRRACSAWRNFRVLTAICYMNDADWSHEDGGQLRCFAPIPADEPTADEAEPSQPGTDPVGAKELEVVPHGGTIVVFPSCTVPHEVLPSRRARYAVTLWFVTPSLLQGSPESRAQAAASLRCREAARRVRQKLQDKGGTSGSHVPAIPVTIATPTAALAAAWAGHAKGCGKEGGDDGGFSFGF
jgi:hypothetical protein